MILPINLIGLKLKQLTYTMRNNITGYSHKFVLRMSQAEFNECLVVPEDEKLDCVLRIVQKYILTNVPENIWVVTSSISLIFVISINLML